jgi:tRNA threonylcarbamoyladenosine biosynthesis protein TsaE
VELVLKLLNLTEGGIVNFSENLARCIDSTFNSIVIYLKGDLGAGKTTLARGFIQWHGFSRVKSPTYTLVESYENDKISIHHFDCYRISDPEELENIGIREYARPGNIQLIEWPELGNGVVPKADLVISISGNENCRDILIENTSITGTKLLQCLNL